MPLFRDLRDGYLPLPHNALYVALAAALSTSLTPASALAEGQISELADVRASATVPVIDVAVSLSPEADGGGLLMDNADADAGIDVNHLSEMGSIAGEVSFDNNSNTSVRLARIESDATSLNSYFTGTSGNIASFKLGSYDELSWSPASGAKTVYELATSDAADPSAGMIVPLGGTSSATLSLDVSGLSATSSAREAAKDPASARDLMSLTWVFEAAQTPYEQPGGIRDQIADITPNTLSTVTINGAGYYVVDKVDKDGHRYACLLKQSSGTQIPYTENIFISRLGERVHQVCREWYDKSVSEVKEFIVTPRTVGDTKWAYYGGGTWPDFDKRLFLNLFDPTDEHIFLPTLPKPMDTMLISGNCLDLGLALDSGMKNNNKWLLNNKFDNFPFVVDPGTWDFRRIVASGEDVHVSENADIRPMFWIQLS